MLPSSRKFLLELFWYFCGIKLLLPVNICFSQELTGGFLSSPYQAASWRTRQFPRNAFKYRKNKSAKRGDITWRQEKNDRWASMQRYLHTTAEQNVFMSNSPLPPGGVSLFIILCLRRHPCTGGIIVRWTENWQEEIIKAHQSNPACLRLYFILRQSMGRIMTVRTHWFF